MKLWGTFGEAQVLDALVWRSRSLDVTRAFGVCVPVGRRCVMIFVRVRPLRRPIVSLPYMRRSDGVRAALAAHERRRDREAVRP